MFLDFLTQWYHCWGLYGKQGELCTLWSVPVRLKHSEQEVGGGVRNTWQFQYTGLCIAVLNRFCGRNPPLSWLWSWTRKTNKQITKRRKHGASCSTESKVSLPLGNRVLRDAASPASHLFVSSGDENENTSDSRSPQDESLSRSLLKWSLRNFTAVSVVPLKCLASS